VLPRCGRKALLTEGSIQIQAVNLTLNLPDHRDGGQIRGGGAMTKTSTIVCCVAGLLALATASRVRAAGRCGEVARAARRQCTTDAKETFRAAADACRGRGHSCVEACRTESRHCIDRALTKTCAQLARSLADCPVAFRECAGGCSLGASPGGTRQCIADAMAGYRSDVATCARDARSAKLDCRAKVHGCVEDCRTAVDPCDGAVRGERRAAIVTCNRTHAEAIAVCHRVFRGGGAGLHRCLAQAKGEGAVCRDDARQATRQGFVDCRLTLGTCVRACPNQ